MRHHRRKRPAARSQAAPAPPVTVTGGPLGARGDVVAEHEERRLFIPLALPGEVLEVAPGAPRGDGLMAEVRRVLVPSPDRVEPPCPHFGACGGCALQHMAPTAESVWKRALVVEALGRRGIDAQALTAPTVSLPPGTRRRATLGYRATARGVVLGFKERRSHQVVDIAQCPLLRPDLAVLLPGLRRGLAPVLPGGAAGDLFLQGTDSGADVRLDLPAAPDLTAREHLAALAQALDLARLTLRIDETEEPVAVRRQPGVRLGGVSVPVPSGAFLQPSAEGEAALRGLVEAALAGVDGPVADLFCGLGTFSLPLAARHAVTAVDSDGPAVGALGSVAGARLSVVRRDLFDEPLAGRDLANRFAAVVLDPPRAGAAAQCAALAKDGPALVVAVSCAPATFARDARLLLDAGYTLEKVTPVDQFAWSPHLELVAVFRRTG